MYRCLCGATFERPLKRRETACHGYEIRETLFYRLCPQCGLGEPYFEEIGEGDATSIGVCPVCGRDVGLGDDYEWSGGEAVHRECLGEYEEGEDDGQSSTALYKING